MFKYKNIIIFITIKHCFVLKEFDNIKVSNDLSEKTWIVENII